MTTRELEYTDLVHACSPAVKAGAAAASTTTTTVATKIRSASGLTPLEQKLTQVFGSLVPWHTSGVSHAAATSDAQELWEQTRTLVLLWQMIQTIIQPLRLFYAQTLSSTIEQLPLRLETNARQYSYLQHRLEMLQSRARDLDHRIRILATGMNENLQKRAAGLSELLLHRKPMITPLERQCFRQLERQEAGRCPSLISGKIGRCYEKPNSVRFVKLSKRTPVVWNGFARFRRKHERRSSDLCICTTCGSRR
jgi:hypothetical protein